MAAGVYVNVDCCETAHCGQDIMPQSPGLPPDIVRTPTPPWATGTEVAAPRNTAAGVATEGPASGGEAPLAPRKTKRVRVRFDTRTELTDEELKVLPLF